MPIDIETSFFGAAVDISMQLLTSIYPNLLAKDNAWDVYCNIDMTVQAARNTFLYQHGTSGEKIPIANDVSFSNLATNFVPNGRWVDCSVNVDSNRWNNAVTEAERNDMLYGAAYLAARSNGGPTRVFGDQKGQEGITEWSFGEDGNPVLPDLSAKSANNPPAPCHYDADDASNCELNWDLGNRYVYSLAGNRPFMRHILEHTSDVSLTTYIQNEIEDTLQVNIEAQLTRDASGTLRTEVAGESDNSIQAQIYGALYNDSSGVQRLEEDISNGVGFADASGLPLVAGDTISIYAIFDLSQTTLRYELLTDAEGPLLVPVPLQSYRGNGNGARNQGLTTAVDSSNGDYLYAYDSYAITDAGEFEPLLVQSPGVAYTGEGFVTYKIVITLVST